MKIRNTGLLMSLFQMLSTAGVEHLAQYTWAETPAGRHTPSADTPGFSRGGKASRCRRSPSH